MPIILHYIICLMYLSILNSRGKYSCTVSMQESKHSYSIHKQYTHNELAKISSDMEATGSYKGKLAL